MERLNRLQRATKLYTDFNGSKRKLSKARNRNISVAALWFRQIEKAAFHLRDILRWVLVEEAIDADQRQLSAVFLLLVLERPEDPPRFSGTDATSWITIQVLLYCWIVRQIADISTGRIETRETRYLNYMIKRTIFEYRRNNVRHVTNFPNSQCLEWFSGDFIHVIRNNHSQHNNN